MSSQPLRSGVLVDETEPLIAKLREAVKLSEPAAITARIKWELESFIPQQGLRLPERFRRPRAESYCRRLLHRDPELGFTALIMTWGPGQCTALHDHSGMWCVEGVVEGEMEVTRYELLDPKPAPDLAAEGPYFFAARGRERARAGSAGALIPPYEYHVLANAQPDRVSLTLHVYGGEMKSCSVFLPEAEDGYRRVVRTLGYDD